jgi:hypothetical protein
VKVPSDFGEILAERSGKYEPYFMPAFGIGIMDTEMVEITDLFDQGQAGGWQDVLDDVIAALARGQ